PARARGLAGRVEALRRQSGDGFVKCHVEAFGQPQCIQAELEWQLVAGDEPRLGDAFARRSSRHVTCGRTMPSGALDASVAGELAVGTRADPEVVAEIPVVAVVSALCAGARIGGHL